MSSSNYSPFRLANSTFLIVTLLVNKRCVFAKDKPVFSNLILTIVA